MNSGASWNERGLSPELYQAAREAASRAGMSVEEWLRSTFGDSAVTAGGRPQTGPLGTRDRAYHVREELIELRGAAVCLRDEPRDRRGE